MDQKQGNVLNNNPNYGHNSKEKSMNFISKTTSMPVLAALGLALAAILALRPSAAEAAESPLELIQATYFGTVGDDDIQGGGVGPDGSIYITGNTGESLANLPGGLVAPTRFGQGAVTPHCGHGFVARLSADGQKVLAYAEFGRGILIMTSVQVNDKGVYASGYATEHLAPLLANAPGFMRQYPLTKQIANLEQAQPSTTRPDPTSETKTKQLDRYGAPFVLRLSPDLKKLECGTYLEGWQQAWAKDRCISTKPKGKFWPTEYTWQPTLLGLHRSGDVIVCHDGGYFRDNTDADRKLAATIADQATAKKLLSRLTFYDVCDHLSRLSPDLSKRAYRQDIYTPAMNLETLRKYKAGWPIAHYGNPRTLRMRLDKDSIFISGWSASATSREPWWSPYLWKMNAADGAVMQKIRETDPMSGKDDRMGGAVADAAITTFALEPDGGLAYARISDGGYRGLIHFSGSIRRMDITTGEDIASARTVPCVWTTDLAVLPHGNLLALGRCNGVNGPIQWTQDAWQKGAPEVNPEAWLRVYGPKLELAFSTAMQGVIPFELVPLSSTRFLVVGQSRGTLDRAIRQADGSYIVRQEPNPGRAIVKNALMDKPPGKSDGYWMIVEYKGAPNQGAGAQGPQP